MLVLLLWDSKVEQRRLLILVGVVVWAAPQSPLPLLPLVMLM